MYVFVIPLGEICKGATQDGGKSMSSFSSMLYTYIHMYTLDAKLVNTQRVHYLHPHLHLFVAHHQEVQ